MGVLPMPRFDCCEPGQTSTFDRTKPLSVQLALITLTAHALARAHGLAVGKYDGKTSVGGTSVRVTVTVQYFLSATGSVSSPFESDIEEAYVTGNAQCDCRAAFI